MANYAKRRPALGWGGVARTPIDTGNVQELGTGLTSRGWRYYGIDGGGPYIPFFGAPAVHGATSYGPVTDAAAAGSAFGADTSSYDFAVLGGWVDMIGIYQSVKSDWIQKTFTGLTPGTTVGFTFARSVLLALGDATLFGEITGVTTSSFSALPAASGLWDDFGQPRVTGQYLTTTVPLSGDVTVRIGIAGMGPTGENGNGSLYNFQLVSIGLPTDTRPNLLVWGVHAGVCAVRSWPRRGAGSARSPRMPSGRSAFWPKPGVDVLAIAMPFIPQVDRLRVGGPNGLDASGADGSLGARACLEYLRDGGIATFYPDQDDLTVEPIDCRLVSPVIGPYDRAGDASLLRNIDWVFETVTPGDVFPEY